MLPILITLSRFPVLALVVGALYSRSQPLQIAGVIGLFLGLLLDTIDGVVARSRHQTSLLGSVLDIAADRTYEVVLWICFADLGLVPLVLPLIIVGRAALVDAFRSVGVRRGATPFSQPRTALGRFLVASSWMRIAYGVSKVLAFCGLAAVQALHAGGSGPVASWVWGARGLAWIVVALCLVRGLPVMLEGLRYSATPEPAR